MQLVNKNIAILGLGEEALDLIAWLKKNSQSCQLTVFDQKSKLDLKEKLNQLKGCQFSLGKKYLSKGLTKFDLVFRSPGVHRLHPAILKAGQHGTIISSPTKLFFDLCPCPIIGVTGTKGKGTTTTLIHQTLNQSGKTSYIAGNIGKPMLALLAKLKKTDYVCLELSSFQLQDLTQGPHLAVLLNTTSEHLDVHQSVKEYRQAKQNIFKFQTNKDFAVVNADYLTTKNMAKKTKAKLFWFSRQKKVNGSYVKGQKIYLFNHFIGKTNQLLLRGQHNWENITAAITASFLAGADLRSIKKTVFSFKGLEHRLELVASLNKIKFYNDSFSTTPETAIAALKSFNEPLTLILGGSDKGSDFTKLGQAIVKAKNLTNIILIGLMAKKIKTAIDRAGKFNGQIILNLKNINQIVDRAYQASAANGVVVLSPACASFDMFKNYKDRGNQFKKAVWDLKEKKST